MWTGIRFLLMIAATVNIAPGSALGAQKPLAEGGLEEFLA